MSSLPKSLDETYERIIQDLQDIQQWDAIKLLQFLAFTDRPLELFEAVDLLAVDVPEARTETETKTLYFDPDNRMPEPLDIVEACSSLVVLDSHNPERKRIQLAHFTVKEYLVSGRITTDLLKHFEEIPAHSSIVNICLGYLESVLPSVTSICTSDTDDIFKKYERRRAVENDRLRFPLMDYAMKIWPVHARRCSQHPETSMQIQKFFEHESCLIKWLLYFCATRYLPVEVDNPEELQLSCPVLLSIYLGLQGMALEMINTGFKLETEVISEQVLDNLNGGTYLSNNHDMKYATGDRRSCRTSHLYLATAKGIFDVVTALVERGVDIHEEGGELGTALNVAYRHGSDDIAATLLQRSKDSVCQECHKQYIQGALETIVDDRQNFNLRVRDRLVESCLALDNPGSLLDYCLKTVFFDGDLDLARRLLRKGARVDVIARGDLRDIFYDEDFLLSFLHLFSRDESDNIDPDALQKLFARESRYRGYPMTEETIQKGFNRVLSFMIAHGVDRECYIPLDHDRCSIFPIAERTSLFCAVERRNTMTVQVLLNVNATLPYKDDFGDYTPSISYINKRDGHNQLTCLHEAAKSNCTEIMKALLSCKADLEHTDSCLLTPLHTACKYNSLEAVKLLVESGANLQAVDFSNTTPLHMACMYNSLEAVKLLVEHGANLQALDLFNRTPLDAARNPTSGPLGNWEPRKSVIEWLEQQNSQISSNDGFHPKRENEADNDDSFSTERDSKRQKTGQRTFHQVTSSRMAPPASPNTSRRALELPHAPAPHSRMPRRAIPSFLSPSTPAPSSSNFPTTWAQRPARIGVLGAVVEEQQLDGDEVIAVRPTQRSGVRPPSAYPSR